MAKTLKRMQYVILEADETGTVFGKCKIAYDIGSSDDTDLTKGVNKEETLTGQDLTDAQNLFNNCKSKVETDEGI